MARTKVGRNDPCPCGSGKKYKRCCEGKSRRLSFAGWAAIVAIAAAAAVAALLVYNLSQGDMVGTPACPPGQSWSAAHRHCH